MTEHRHIERDPMVDAYIEAVCARPELITPRYEAIHERLDAAASKPRKQLGPWYDEAAWLDVWWPVIGAMAVAGALAALAVQ